MGEAIAGTYPAAGPVEDYRVPDGMFGITLDDHYHVDRQAGRPDATSLAFPGVLG
jgi:hypothetical protein